MSDRAATTANNIFHNCTKIMKASGSSATSSPSKGTTDGRVLDEGTIRRQQGQVKGGSLAARIQSAQAKNADRPGSAEELPYVDAPLQKVRYT